ncbi:MAG: LPFR motif small protein [Solirubrobacteraceae bacterium]
MISAIFDVIRMVVGLILDIVTLPFRAIFALLGGAEFEFQRFSRPRHE